MSLYFGIDPYQQGSQMYQDPYARGGRSNAGGFMASPGAMPSMPGMDSGGQQQGFGQAPQNWEDLINMATPKDGGQSWLEQYYSPSFDGGFASQDADKRRAFGDYNMLAKTAGFDLSGGEVFTPYAFQGGNVDPSMDFMNRYVLSGAPTEQNASQGLSSIYKQGPTQALNPLTGQSMGQYDWQWGSGAPNIGQQYQGYQSWLQGIQGRK